MVENTVDGLCRYRTLDAECVVLTGARDAAETVGKLGVGGRNTGGTVSSLGELVFHASVFLSR